MSMSGHTVRAPAVAGKFYPDDPVVLRQLIEQWLEEVNLPLSDLLPKGLIVPHAGYPYSGPVAASGYSLVGAHCQWATRVLLLGPAHYVPFRGIAASSASVFQTPLGEVPVDQAAVQAGLKLPGVVICDEAHLYEHSLEVQLPFLQVCLSDFQLAPFVVGEAEADEVAELILSLWDERTLPVISTDLSHYLDYWTARAVDQETSELIQSLRWQDLSGERACGYKPLQGMLEAVAARNLKVTAVDVRNSGDTAGDRSQVVGYGCYVIHQ